MLSLIWWLVVAPTILAFILGILAKAFYGMAHQPVGDNETP